MNAVAKLYRPYPAYRPSGVDWLGGVPEHWRLRRLKFTHRLMTAKAENGNQQAFRVALENLEGWTGRHLETASEFAGEGVLFSRDDLLFGKLRPYLAKVWLADRQGEALGDFYVLRPGEECHPRFSFYTLISRGFINVVDSSTYGTKMPRANWDFVGNMVPALPPLPEQRAIAAFLDRETRRIDALVVKKRRLIELLEEKRGALISHAVTKGLDPNVPMKDSGIEWLGDVPEHWEVGRLKFRLVGMEQGWSPQCEGRLADEEEWGVLKVGCVNGSVFNAYEHKALPAELPPRRAYEVRQGDVLMSRANTRELVGSAAIVRGVRPKLILCDKLYRLKPRIVDLDADYLVHILRCRTTRHQFEGDATGASSSMVNIGQDSVRELVAAFPPVQEQQAIVREVTKRAERLDALTSRNCEVIEKLQEYRTALISAAVTGKIDVRGLQSRSAGCEEATSGK